MMLLTAEEYFERHRTESGNLACDDNWYSSTTSDSLSMYPMSLPWYLTGQATSSCLKEQLTKQ